MPYGTLFALVAGTTLAKCVYPRYGQGLVRADDATRAEAVEVGLRLRVDGGTAMSTWLDLVRELVEPSSLIFGA